MYSRFHVLLRQKLDLLAAKKTEELTKGVPTDYPQYLAAVTYLNALEDVRNLCEETDRELG